MAAIYRPPTIEERFFGHTTIVNVPVSLPPEKLSEIYTAPVDTTPLIPDLTQSSPLAPSTLSKVGVFVSNNSVYILLGVVIVGSACWYYKIKKEKSKKSPTVNTAA